MVYFLPCLLGNWGNLVQANDIHAPASLSLIKLSLLLLEKICLPNKSDLISNKYMQGTGSESIRDLKRVDDHLV